MEDTLRSPTVSTKLQQIAEQARRYPKMVFTTLAHHIDVEFLREAYHLTRKDSAPGIDGMTAKQYAEHLVENLCDLDARRRSGQYRAMPVKRVWLEKEDGSQRPIGMPVFEDKILERAVTMLLGAVYEQDFYSFSHGFREGHSPHQALHELREQSMKLNINWIVDLDICGFFGNLGHEYLREVLQIRIKDGGILSLIGKWLKAGVIDGETLMHPEKGTPQGSVISPMVANIFLHHVLDDWWVKEVQPRLKGRAFLIRFADDVVIGCECENDARRILEVLPKRCGKYGLNLHPQKTKLVRFVKPKREATNSDSESFDFLGFTHYWDKSRQGNWVIKRKTAKKRLRRTIKAFWQWCRDHCHWPLPEQYRILSLKLRGYYQYYAIRGNYPMLIQVLKHVEQAWRYWLSRRSRKSTITWQGFQKLKTVFPLPIPRILHTI